MRAVTMIAVLALAGMPILLMGVALLSDAVLRRHPRKDDLWQLPKVSSLGAALPRRL